MKNNRKKRKKRKKRKRKKNRKTHITLYTIKSNFTKRIAKLRANFAKMLFIVQSVKCKKKGNMKRKRKQKRK